MISNQKLNARQQRFVDEYLANGGNATQAAIAAGYSEKSAEVTACKLLRNAKVAKAVETGQQEIKKDLGITAEWKREQLRKITENCMSVVTLTKGSGENVTVFEAMIDPKGATSAIAELNRMDGDLAAIKTDNKHTGSVTHVLKDMLSEIDGTSTGLPTVPGAEGKAQ